MANTKITELTAVTALTGTDVFPVVDVSADTTNKVSVEDLLRNAPDGTAGVPSIANANDQDTGIFFPADNSVGVSTDGTQRLVIDSSGRVGIGTTSAGANLHVSSTGDTIARVTSADGNGAFLDLGDASDPDGGRIVYDSASNLAFSTASSERLRIDSSGRVLLGTTSDVSGSTDSKLQVISSGGARLALGRDDTSVQSGNTIGDIQFYANDQGSQDRIGSIRCTATSGHTATSKPTNLLFETTNNASVTPAEAMRIDNGGRLLIGYSSNEGASRKLQVSATGSGSGIEVFRYASGASAAPSILLSKSKSDTLGTNTLVSNNHKVGSLQFRGADGSAFRQAAEIFVEIDGTSGASDMPGRLVFACTPDGSTSSTERVHIRQDGQLRHFADTTPSAVFSTVNTGSTNKLIQGRSGGSSIDSLGTEVFIVRADGDVENTNNSYTAISDVKLKENIVDANSQWSDLKALRVRNYNFKEETNYSTHTQIGLVAQEVETVSPGLVSESPDIDDDGNDLGTTTKAVNYSVLYMKAVKALQEAMERIETLETKVAALEAQ